MKLGVLSALLLAVILLAISCQSNDALDFDRYYAQGSVIYRTRCQNCHGAKGEGLNGLIPPLTDTVYLRSHLHQLPCFVQNGVASNITVATRPFSGKMPANADLANIDVAELLTYITNSFGNKMGITKVENVNQDIQNCR